MTLDNTVLCAALICAFPTIGWSQEVAVFNWAEYYAEDTINTFEAEYDIKVIENFFDSNAVQETKVMTGGSGFDVVFPSISGAERQLAAGALQPIDPTRLENYGNLNPDLLAALDKVPGGTSLGVPYTWGTIGIAYNKDMVAARLGDQAMDSWDILMQPETASKLADCGIGIIDSAAEIIPITLNYLGKDPYSSDDGDLGAAFAVLSEFAASVRYFSSINIASDLASGNICVAVTYNGEAGYAQSIASESGKDIEIGYAIPGEGTMMWMDMMAIPIDAPHLEEAYTFINYLLRPEVIAAVTNTVYYANANAAATELVDPDIRNDPGTYPSAETLKVLFSDRNVDAATLRAWNRLWTRVKTGT